MVDSDFSAEAIRAAYSGKMAFCKFLSANDTGDTGAHQSGIYVQKHAFPILFDEEGVKGENKDKYVHIRWQNSFETSSRFIYYGKGTRNEYRITRGIPDLDPEHTGDLFVLVKLDPENYLAYMLQTEDEINSFLNEFGMSPADTGGIIQKEDLKLGHTISPEELSIMAYIEGLNVDFPSSAEMSEAARSIYNEIFNHKENIRTNPDKEIIGWVDMEYRLFRMLETYRYGSRISKGFDSVEEFIKIANVVLNRRKSRAGKSLEHHLSAIFDGNSLRYVPQPVTEGHKKPDFLFPDAGSYHDHSFPADHLIFLGAKTTCKDRWRQILNEADRINVKHLFTLQQGISVRQLDEMEKAGVILVVPKLYIKTFPKEKQDSIWTLKKFIDYVKEKESV
ncbi:type II restriction endonuclease [Sporolactobacillus sp. THM19-2]|uniref:type II restriction endonuclease n=1 Tax=Sporolactobacillus sp. THM19-2 TaxID=2511171 RepID=UPI001980D59E|nr:type II restriction endonuclease [Sporolactobacillus sp. THM19-2]